MDGKQMIGKLTTGSNFATDSRALRREVRTIDGQTRTNDHTSQRDRRLDHKRNSMDMFVGILKVVPVISVATSMFVVLFATGTAVIRDRRNAESVFAERVRVDRQRSAASLMDASAVVPRRRP